MIKNQVLRVSLAVIIALLLSACEESASRRENSDKSLAVQKDSEAKQETPATTQQRSISPQPSTKDQSPIPEELTLSLPQGVAGLGYTIKDINGSPVTGYYLGWFPTVADGKMFNLLVMDSGSYSKGTLSGDKWHTEIMELQLPLTLRPFAKSVGVSLTCIHSDAKAHAGARVPSLSVPGTEGVGCAKWGANIGYPNPATILIRGRSYTGHAYVAITTDRTQSPFVELYFAFATKGTYTIPQREEDDIQQRNPLRRTPHPSFATRVRRSSTPDGRRYLTTDGVDRGQLVFTKQARYDAHGAVVHETKWLLKQ